MKLNNSVVNAVKASLNYLQIILPTHQVTDEYKITRLHTLFWCFHCFWYKTAGNCWVTCATTVWQAGSNAMCLLLKNFVNECFKIFQCKMFCIVKKINSRITEIKEIFRFLRSILLQLCVREHKSCNPKNKWNINKRSVLRQWK